MMKLRVTLPVMSLLLMVISAGASSIDYWVTSPLHNVFKDMNTPIRRTTAIKMVAARNQTENAQVVLVPKNDIKGVHIEFEPLVSKSGCKIDQAGFEYNFLEYHHVAVNSSMTPPELLLRKAPDEFPDAFLEDRNLDITSGRNWPVFLTFPVPVNAEPGIYTGKLWIVSGDERTPVDVSLEVLPVTLPDDTRLSVTLWFNHGNVSQHSNHPLWSDGYWEDIKSVGKMMHAHHQNIAWAGHGLIKIFKEPDGKVTFDFSLLDKWVETFDSVGVNRLIEIDHISYRIDGAWETDFVLPPWKGTDSATGKEVDIEVEEWAPALQKHMEEKGWLDRTALHIGDEPIEPNYKSWLAISRRFHAAAPKIKRIDAVLTPKVLNDIEIAVPSLDHCDYFPKELREFANKEGNQFWFYTAWVPQGKYPNRLMDYPVIKTRLLHWINYRYQITGYLHWALFMWQAGFPGLAPGDNWIVWPGSKGPRSSIRYEAVRSGIEDYEFMAMLEDATARVADKLGAKIDPRKRSMELSSRILRSATDYDISPAKLESTRTEILRELSSIEKSPLILVDTDPAEGSKADIITVTGAAEKGSILTINGNPVKLDAHGKFTVKTSDKSLVITAKKNDMSKTIVRLFK
ncbi:MAG: DUF4091 domain-containing protein [Armatimonadota bacterium]